MTTIDRSQLRPFLDHLEAVRGFRKLPTLKSPPLFRFTSPRGLGGVLRLREQPGKFLLLSAADEYWERFCDRGGR